MTADILTTIFEQYKEIADQKKNITPFGLIRMYKDLRDAEISFKTRSLSEFQSQLILLDQRKEFLIFYLRYWKETCDRIGIQLDLEFDPEPFLTLGMWINDIDVLIEKYAQEKRKGQLTLFKAYIERENPRTITKKIDNSMRAGLKRLLDLWKKHFTAYGERPPLNTIFSEEVKWCLCDFLAHRKISTLERQFKQLVRQWGFGTLRNRDLVLDTRLKQLYGEFELQQENGVPYWTHSEKSIMLMLNEDILSLPFYQNKQILATNIARRATRPILPNTIPDLDWKRVEVEDKTERIILHGNGTFVIDFDDYYAAMLATTGLAIKSIEFLPSQALIIVFVENSETAILIGRQKT